MCGLKKKVIIIFENILKHMELEAYIVYSSI